MSASIPIPTRNPGGHSSPCLSSESAPLAASLPARAHLSFDDVPGRHRPQPLLATQDDLATISWPPRPSVELVSRAAKKFAAHSNHRTNLASNPGRRTPFDPWDFSEVVTATAEVRTAFRTGSARAERPPRDGVSGTYFIRRNESNADVLCVFKPVDEEVADIEMSPTSFPAGATFGTAGILGDGEFTLGPSHGMASPLAQSPPSGSPTFHTTGSLSSESEFESRLYRASGFHAGEGAYKEVAAYLLDHGRFAKVPQTALAKCNFTSDVDEKNADTGSPGPSFFSESGEELSDSDDDNPLAIPSLRLEMKSHLRTKMGAFQVYCRNVGDADDFGPGVFDKDQAHRIAILDIRTLNHDRHGGNILVTQSASVDHRFDLVPIDHGFILPDTVRSIPWPVWMDWPMIRKPLSDKEKQYIELLDPDSEAHILEEELDGKLRTGSLQGLKIATKLLQKGVAAGLTLYEIGLLMYTKREEPGEMSELEKIMSEAEEANRARESVFAEITAFPQGMPRDHNYHRRHQSMSSFTSHEVHINDYIVRYATRRIQEVVHLIAAAKETERQTASTRARRPRLSRARSIPDFGIGIKPLHALMAKPGDSTVPLNTPVSSPVSELSRSVDANLTLESQLPRLAQSSIRQAPIQIPINDGSIRRIAIPEPRTLPRANVAALNHDAVARVIGGTRSGSGIDEIPSTDMCPPRFKSTNRNSSPVAPLDVLTWETRTS